MVMYAGRQVEVGTGLDDVFYRDPPPVHARVCSPRCPRLDDVGDEELRPIGGQPPSMINLPPGCSFHPRCDYAEGRARCREERRRCATSAAGTSRRATSPRSWPCTTRRLEVGT